MANKFFEKLEQIERLLVSQKETLNVDDLHFYTGWSKSFIYKNTASKKIPHCKPYEGAKMLFFKRIEIDAYLTAHRVKTADELDLIVNYLL